MYDSYLVLFNVFNELVLTSFRHSVSRIAVNNARVVYFRLYMVEDLRFKEAFLMIIATSGHDR